MERKSLRAEVSFPFCPNTCQYCDMPSDYATAMLMGGYCDALGRELERVLAWEPQHLSVLPFEVPAGSVLERELGNLRRVYGARAEGLLPSEGLLAEMADHARDALATRGFAEYLPGRFCLPGHERRHLLDEAAGVECLALGCGGVTHLDGVCSQTTRDVERYVEHPGDLAAITERAWET